MSCPDEDTFARFAEGLLPPGEAAAVERHVDGCARCGELAAAFGRAYAPGPTERGAAGGREAGAALILSAGLHAAWAVVVVHAPVALAALFPAALAAGYRGYALVWGPLGALSALVAAVALRRGWRAAGRWAALHAALALPSVVLTPLALFVIFALRRRDIAARAAS
jgi:hypothetical protein